jgi:hypothetical protein
LTCTVERIDPEMDTATIKVKLDGDTFDFELPTELVDVDTSNPTAVAERNNLVREELAGFKPETAEGELEWTTTDGGVQLNVTRKTKAKGQEGDEGSGQPADLSPVLRHLLAAPETMPLALGLALTLRAREIAGRLDGVTLLRCRSSILAARAREKGDVTYAERVLAALLGAEAKPSPCTPVGF